MNRRPKPTTKRLPPPTKSEAAFERALEAFSSKGAPRGASQPALIAETRDAFIDQLFARKNEFLEDDRFRTIGEAASFFTKIVGVSFEGRQDIVAGLTEGSPLHLERQPDNAYDTNAIAVHFGSLQIGFVKKDIARHLAPKIDSGTNYHVEVGSLTGGGEKNFGVNIFVRREHASASLSIEIERGRAGGDALRAALIGDRPLRESQREVLSRLQRGRNTLAVLGTGRGKSFCFQYPAAMRALESRQKTLVIYPLRALANDQYEALIKRFDGFGLRIFRANGSISPDERSDLMNALETGAWDIILATPEFLQFHDRAFGSPSKPDFVVIDEAHHLYDSQHRAAYGKLGSLVASLGTTQILALTATAGDNAFAHIVKELRIDAWVIDPTVRENLIVKDARGRKDKERYLGDVFEGSGKGIVYCNSRTGAVKVAESLRAAFGNQVAFYHAGVPTPERLAVERLFREGEVRIVVATSAFGEGIDLPDVRDVVLYHLNFNFTEFNQQAGRAGRDGKPARIHLLFGQADRRINDFIIDREAPTLPLLRQIYKGMRGLTTGGYQRSTFVDIARTLELDKANERTISVATRIFEGAGLLESGVDDDGRFLRFISPVSKVDMTKNERFAEGEAEREDFSKFCDLILSANPAALQNIINRPIYPQGVDLLR
ncbi:MAG: DEAD/DEAH box helicase [Candidatus Eremiobacteraeota bacterium]|nr:DEAD/DEAH box helicase [Candidatus Eremiobacteraeota bacterium]